MKTHEKVSKGKEMTKTKQPISAKDLKYSQQPFGTRLRNLLRDRDISMSDFARRMWPGEEGVDARGYNFPMGKDLVSKWCNNKSVPNAQNLKRMCDVLSVNVEDFAPDLLLPDMKNEPKELEMTLVAGRPDVARLTVNTLVPTDVALKVLTLITTAKESR